MRFRMKEHLRQLIKFSEGEKCTIVDPPGPRLFKAESIFEEHMKSNLMTLVEPIYEQLLKHIENARFNPGETFPEYFFKTGQ